MRRFWIAIAIALALVPVFWAMVLHFDPLCGEELIREEHSPDGRYVAVLMERNCGATTRYVKHINLRRADRKFSSGFFDGTIKDGEIFTFEGSVEFEWVGKELKVHSPTDEGVFRKQTAWNDVVVEYVP